MHRVLLVPKGIYDASVSRFGALAKSSAVTILWYDLPSGVVGPSHFLGMAYGAEVGFVSLSPKIIEVACQTYQMIPREGGIFRGSLTTVADEICSWIQPLEVDVPTPSFSEIAKELKALYSPIICYTEQALRLADRVSIDPAFSAETFPDFFRQSLVALTTLARDGMAPAADLQEYFAIKAPLSKFASNGQESISFTEPGASPRLHTTYLHLKPARERSGDHVREIKPRLFFKNIRINGLTIAVVCYFGPHPETRSHLSTGPMTP